MKSISSWSDIPDFQSEEEEALFWIGHELSPELMKASEHVPDSRESTFAGKVHIGHVRLNAGIAAVAHTQGSSATFGPWGSSGMSPQPNTGHLSLLV